MEFETVIGMEIHAELLTESKIFCSCKNEFGGEENTHCCPICLGLPGTLPVLNKKVVEYAIKAGLALNCKINLKSRLDRKNYHYPDLPKGYQISQREFPLCTNGYLEIATDNGSKKVGITEIHIEEDAGKLVHNQAAQYSIADYNRSCVPLIEIVTEPDMRSAAEAKEFLETLRNILICLGVSDCKMQEGSMRCDVNVSIRPVGSQKLGTRCEIKNLNSFRSVVRAAEAEVKRQKKILTSGGTVEQETLRFDEATGTTYPMRSKEDSQDYRYFPDPDLLPINLTAQYVEDIKSSLPELPHQKSQRYVSELGLPERDAGMISANNAFSGIFEQAIKAGTSPRSAANWIVGNLVSLMNELDMDEEDLKLDGASLANLINMVETDKINSGAGKQVLSEMLKTNKAPEKIAAELSLLQVSDKGELEELAKQIIKDNPNPVNDYLGGKEKALTFLCGTAMKLTKGKANPKLIRELLIELLEQQRNK